MTKHTPGPWTREEGQRFRHDQSAGIKAADGLFVATALDKNRIDLDAEVEANARLIAAAPELLDALKSALLELERINKNIYVLVDHFVIEEIRGAIAKAKGES